MRRRWRTARGPTDAAIGCTQATPPSGSPALPCAPSSRVSSTGPKYDRACSQVTPARQPTPAPGHHLPMHSQSTLAQAGSRPTSPRGEPPPANRTLPRLPRLPPRRSRLTFFTGKQARGARRYRRRYGERSSAAHRARPNPCDRASQGMIPSTVRPSTPGLRIPRAYSVLTRQGKWRRGSPTQSTTRRRLAISSTC